MCAPGRDVWRTGRKREPGVKESEVNVYTTGPCRRSRLHHRGLCPSPLRPSLPRLAHPFRDRQASPRRRHRRRQEAVGGPGDREEVLQQRLRQEARAGHQEEKPQRLRALQGHAPQEAGEFWKREDGVGEFVGLGTNQSFNHLRHTLAMSQQWSNADQKLQARFQVRKTLAAAKAA
jgi:hypothetical protein